MSQSSFASLMAPGDATEPSTPEPGASSVVQTPPPSSQLPAPSRKARTPTPTFSHISTPPPTIETSSQRIATESPGVMTAEQIATASVEELRPKVTELQAALQDANMSAAHHKLQYKMLAQESAAAIERMAVEARMAQYENDVIHSAEQAKAAATPAQQSPAQQGMIPVQKELYQQMCRDIHLLTEANRDLAKEAGQQQTTITMQESEITTLNDRVTLLRDRIRENREHLNKYRRPQYENTPRSVYSTPHRSHRQDRPEQPFAALLQASEMASQNMGPRKGHQRNTHSMSSLPVTPQHHMHNKPLPPTSYQTPRSQHRPQHMSVPATAPQPRTSSLRTPDMYNKSLLPVVPSGPPSDGTVSASDDDSEAETDIIELDDNITEPQASRTASQMLRTSQEQQQKKRDSFTGGGMLPAKAMKQTQLFGAVRKGNVERERGGEEPPSKRARMGEQQTPVGLGIAGVRD